MEGRRREEFRSYTPLARKKDYPDFVGVIVSGNLERKDGKYLMGKNTEGVTRSYLRTDMRNSLQNLTSPSPEGYLSEGKFIF